MVSAITIMVVDDSKGDRHLVKHHLKSMGLENTLEAGDGETALALLDKTKVDLIIADWYMPNMSGLIFYQKVQENKNLKDIPFLMTTAEETKEKIIQAMKLGIRHYIIKPFSPEDFKEKVKSLLKAA